MSSDYDDFVESTWIESHSHKEDVARCALGLAGESGEVAELVKKFLRGDGLLDQERVLSELGDVLYYVAILAHRMGGDLAGVQELNQRKLESRHKRGVIKGSGDDR